MWMWRGRTVRLIHVRHFHVDLGLIKGIVFWQVHTRFINQSSFCHTYISSFVYTQIILSVDKICHFAIHPLYLVLFYKVLLAGQYNLRYHTEGSSV